MEPFSLLLFLPPLLLLFYFLNPSHPRANASAAGEGFPCYPILGSLPAFLKNRHRFLDWATDVLRRCPTHTSVFLRPGKVPSIITADPTNLEHILKTNFDNYPKGERFIPPYEDFLGSGIFASDGDVWKAQRNTAVHEFNTRSLRKFVMETVTVQIQTRLLPVLKEAAAPNDRRQSKTLDLQDVFERFAFDSVCKVAFDVDPRCLGGDGTASADFMLAFDEASLRIFGRFFYTLPVMWKIKRMLNVGSEKKLREAIRRVHEFADNVIRERKEKKVEKLGEDLLSRFMKNIDKDSTNPAEFLRYIVVNFILAGKDTTSSVLSWFFWLLSQAPDVEKNILKELETIRIQSGRAKGDAFTFDDLREMTYFHAALSETLRLHPPVALNQKSCLKDDVLPDGTFVGKGWGISYCTYAMGRMESIWGTDCCEFKPERWFDENGAYRHESPFRFPAFNGGPRTCLGREMAYIQMKGVAATLLEGFVVDVMDKKNVPETAFSVVHKMKHGLPVKIRQRSI